MEKELTAHESYATRDQARGSHDGLIQVLLEDTMTTAERRFARW